MYTAKGSRRVKFEHTHIIMNRTQSKRRNRDGEESTNDMNDCKESFTRELWYGIDISAMDNYVFESI